MASAINENFPVNGNPTTQSVRDNFSTAKTEITNLQNQVATLMLNMPYLPLSGGTMLGSMKVAADPVEDMEPATKAFVDALQATIAALEARVAALENPPEEERR